MDDKESNLRYKAPELFLLLQELYGTLTQGEQPSEALLKEAGEFLATVEYVEQEHHPNESRLERKAPELLKKLTCTVAALKDGNFLEESFRTHLRDLLNSVDHADRR